ncbi:lipid A biosynthesis acyltransferase [Catenulispora acidiphila DSM 44928]|uniref:Lipid A biosynthesis acyltransferase n=1 Tax=Catenulispora acidiphila (strain DSM 44928 / JCM 14897 / NBRC 102108 / NRRL B-24433 / ID139908) TaxID=479433 RepID=C7QJN9_CATAD|nr:phosphatidylinositol mannoside acyltransferase [Catenulispora acidiphila]ACU71262.1 lipid A biosynthesis acyltransferase [Catenulispora acidiphila DSM 44928]
MKAESVNEKLVSFGYGAAWTAVKLLPERAAYRVFDLIADRLWARRGGAVRQLEKNLLRVLGKDTSEKQLREVSRKAMRSALRQYCEQFRVPTWSRERIMDSVDFPAEDIGRLKEALGSGRGVIMALGHTGNYDHAGVWLVNFMGEGFTTVAEHLKPESVGEKFLDYRRGLGMEVLPHDGGPSVFGTLARRLRAGKAVALVADRDLSASGAQVTMFGEATRIAAGPAALAVQTGAALLPVQLWYPSYGRMSIRVRPEIPVPAEGKRPEKVAVMCQQLADNYAAGIAAHPADWHMMQKFFLADLDPAKAPKAAAAAKPAEAAGAEAATATATAKPAEPAMPAAPEAPESTDVPQEAS